MDSDRLSDYRLQQDGSFLIENYRDLPLFYSFLPGIAGIHGMPMWVFYTNRGQGICSFGIESKVRSMMEFFPAHQAASRVELQGFRTFLKVNGIFYEPFASSTDDNVSMRIDHNMLEITSVNKILDIHTQVVYFIAVDQPFPALIRRITVTNRSKTIYDIDIADGMPQIIPCGISNMQFKAEGNTFRAWADTKRLPSRAAFYGVSQSLNDSSKVRKPEDGFFCAVYMDGKTRSVIADPTVLFGKDVSLQYPHGFVEHGASVGQMKQYSVDRVPCAFSAAKKMLEYGECLQIDSVYGYAKSMEEAEFATQILSDSFDLLQRKAKQLAFDLLKAIHTKTADQKFDAYIGQCYLDNLLRGGLPYVFQSKRGPLIHHIYGRRHGDLERDYNEFELQPTYYSQGNGSYRDLCQNRRNDVWFTPESGLFNIRIFIELLQIDGYNPLVINGCKYCLNEKDADSIVKNISNGHIAHSIRQMLCEGFTPGTLLQKAKELEESNYAAEELLRQCMFLAKQEVCSEHKTGYWSDHFSYNMDLLESYLAIYPDKLEEILYKETFRFHNTCVRVQPRSKQYTITKNGVRQYNATVISQQRHQAMDAEETRTDFLRNRDGSIVKVSLYVKLLSLAINKFCCFDPSGMGIEMEAGKPGWNDSLNGLPGLMGSGLPETIELIRIVQFLLDVPVNMVIIPVEIFEQLQHVKAAIYDNYETFSLWEQLGDIRERFRERVYDMLSGECVNINVSNISKTLSSVLSMLKDGISRAQREFSPLLPTYLYHEISEYTINENGIHPQSFTVHALPYFLEAPARQIRQMNKASAQQLHAMIKETSLYDKDLKMFKICTSLEGLSDELGRARAFPCGWFENESVFLHMSYKYLLGLLEVGAYDTFFEEMKTSLVPFFNPKCYGRSTLENCSFIASTVNHDPATHGRGYIARLSGATAEMISIWSIMMTGGKLFAFEQGELYLNLKPRLPSWLFDEKDTVTFSILGNTEFCIYNPRRRHTYDEDMYIDQYEIIWKDGEMLRSKKVYGKNAIKLREKGAKSVIAKIGFH